MNNLPKRKPNRLKNFDYSSCGAYFITICVQNKECLLSRIVGGGAYDAPKNILTEFGEIAEKNIVSGNKIPHICVENYVIMPNHIHMILRIKNNGTSEALSPAQIT